MGANLRSQPSRHTLEAAIEEAITLLDALDGDPDLEPEPDEDGGDREPSLGSPDRVVNQSHWARQRLGPAFLGIPHLDCELDESDREPSLGSPETVHAGMVWWFGADRRTHQLAWAAGGVRDLEDDPAELGIGDHGGLAEQFGPELDGPLDGGSGSVMSVPLPRRSDPPDWPGLLRLVWYTWRMKRLRNRMRRLADKAERTMDETERLQGRRKPE